MSFPQLKYQDINTVTCRAHESEFHTLGAEARLHFFNSRVFRDLCRRHLQRDSAQASCRQARLEGQGGLGFRRLRAPCSKQGQGYPRALQLNEWIETARARVLRLQTTEAVLLFGKLEDCG